MLNGMTPGAPRRGARNPTGAECGAAVQSDPIQGRCWQEGTRGESFEVTVAPHLTKSANTIADGVKKLLEAEARADADQDGIGPWDVEARRLTQESESAEHRLSDWIKLNR